MWWESVVLFVKLCLATTGVVFWADPRSQVEIGMLFIVLVMLLHTSMLPWHTTFLNRVQTYSYLTTFGNVVHVFLV